LRWRQPTYTWSKWYRRVALNRYCTGYKKSAFNHRSVENCGSWVKQVDPWARYFFFREQGNYHCSPCPQSYKGHPTSGTGYQNSKIYTYRILNWRRPVYPWEKWYKRVALNRYCTGYKKSAFNHRTVINCANWVKKVDPYARFFFFREQGNYHCSPCPRSYRGGNAGTGYQNSKIYTYRIIGWRQPTYPGQKDYPRIVLNRYCTGYKKSAFNHRSVIACANWVRSVDKWARFFFFREEGNYHCSPCPRRYTGGNRYTNGQNSRIYIYRISGWREPPSPYRPLIKGRYCTGYTRSNNSFRNYIDCGKWVAKNDRYARWFFFRYGGNYMCAACP
jgi:hypothetical protein